MLTSIAIVMAVITTGASLAGRPQKKMTQPLAKTPEQITLMTLDPGHFHAALVQKTMYPQIAPQVYIYAPAGPDVNEHLKRIEGYNTRADNPTDWKLDVYTGQDFLEKMLKDRPGNVVVLSGNNKKKAQYIKACVEAGLNVYADKPMCIDSAGCQLLLQAFDVAANNGLLLYDIMTERSEITNILQKELIRNPDVFGTLEKGSPGNPAVVRQSEHFFFKYVSGKPNKRPGWYFDTDQQGQGIVDVTTHLIDLVMWACFPDQPIDYQRDIKLNDAMRWPRLITSEQFQRVTGLADWPDYLKGKLDTDGCLPCYANGQIDFTIKGVHAAVKVRWEFQAAEGAGDSQYSLIRGTKATTFILQGKEQNYKPQLYLQPAPGADKNELAKSLQKAIADLQAKYPGISLEAAGDIWHIVIPDHLRTGHEEHFAMVTQRFLNYLKNGKLPDWELANMKTKYRLTTDALALALDKQLTVNFIPSENKIDCLIGGNLFTSYLFDANLTKPVLFPIRTPSGIVITRGFPLDPRQGDSEDHPHHIGLFFTYDDVNGAAFWNNTAAPPMVKHIEVTEMSNGRGLGTLGTISHWLDKSGRVLLEEKRKMLFYASHDQYAIEFDINLAAQKQKVVFGDTKEGMFAIRVADWLKEEGGSGKYLNSDGLTSEKQVWGKRANWVCLQGQKGPKTVGIAVFNHPSSVNFPTYWHARGYGLFSANPLGQFVFQKDTGAPSPQPFNLTLLPGQTARFRFLTVFYEGPKTAQELNRQFEEFAASN